MTSRSKKPEPNPFKIGDYVRVTVEGRVENVSERWQDNVGWINVDTGLDVQNFDYNETVSVEKVEPPFEFPDSREAVISGIDRITGTKWFFHRNGESFWVALSGGEGVSVNYRTEKLIQCFKEFKAEWSGA